MIHCFKNPVFFACGGFPIWEIILSFGSIVSVFRMGRTCKEFKKIVDKLASRICAGDYTNVNLQTISSLAHSFKEMELNEMLTTPDGSRGWFWDEYYEFDNTENEKYAEEFFAFATEVGATISIRSFEPTNTRSLCYYELEKFGDFFKRVKLILYHAIFDVKKDEKIIMHLEVKISAHFRNCTIFEHPVDWELLDDTAKCEYYLLRCCPACNQITNKKCRRFTTKRSIYCKPCLLKIK